MSTCVIFFKKMFHFEVLVCRPLWDSLYTSQRFFFQLVLQLRAESHLTAKKITLHGGFFGTHADSEKENYTTYKRHQICEKYVKMCESPIPPPPPRR